MSKQLDNARLDYAVNAEDVEKLQKKNMTKKDIEITIVYFMYYTKCIANIQGRKAVI